MGNPLCPGSGITGPNIAVTNRLKQKVNNVARKNRNSLLPGLHVIGYPGEIEDVGT